MAIIRKGLPKGNYTKIDNKVFTTIGLTDGAKVLYGYMASKRNGDFYSDTYFMKTLDLSRKTLYRRKKELVECGLIYVDRIGPKSYILYVGHTEVSGLEVKKNWEYIREKNEEGVSASDLKERTKKEMEEIDITASSNDDDIDDIFSDEYEASLEEY